MKKILTLVMTLMILAVLTAPTFAQGRRRTTYCEPTSTSRGNTNYDSRAYYDNSRAYDNSQAYYDYSNQSNQYRGRSVWDRHRDKITLAAGTVGGAALGGLIGGRRGAAIGAVSGAAASAVYAYKVRNRSYRY